ncbi:ribbon-helix-helix domain-containing protein [Inquilinus sp. CAU 1745]|uniref:ribbon-helix-helix domain-containing protein n=1 Tax=Inquilinus sp. CAU 1745 TaxID=3140369 RepID=UPI00325BFF86
MVDASVKRSVTIAGHRTSISLEPEFWAALRAIAERRGQSLNQLVEAIDADRDRNLSSAIRVFVLLEAQQRPSDLSIQPPDNS